MDSDSANDAFLDARVQQVAAWIVRHGLQMPVLLLLEMHKPLRGVLHAGALVIEPSLSLLCGRKQSAALVQVLEQSSGIERLLSVLEAKKTESQEVHGRN